MKASLLLTLLLAGVWPTAAPAHPGAGAAAAIGAVDAGEISLTGGAPLVPGLQSSGPAAGPPQRVGGSTGDSRARGALPDLVAWSTAAIARIRTCEDYAAASLLARAGLLPVRTTAPPAFRFV